MKILAIESSCDETAAAVVEDGRRVLSNVVASQIEIHRRFGGVVPEIASRNHTLAIDNVVAEALEQADAGKDDIDAVAVTYGAGLLGALLVGVNYAKGLAYAWKNRFTPCRTSRGILRRITLTARLSRRICVCLPAEDTPRCFR